MDCLDQRDWLSPLALSVIKSFIEERYIKAVCPENVSFADFVRDYRRENNKIEIYRLK